MSISNCFHSQNSSCWRSAQKTRKKEALVTGPKCLWSLKRDMALGFSCSGCSEISSMMCTSTRGFRFSASPQLRNCIIAKVARVSLIMSVVVVIAVSVSSASAYFQHDDEHNCQYNDHPGDNYRFGYYSQ